MYGNDGRFLPLKLIYYGIYVVGANVAQKHQVCFIVTIIFGLVLYFSVAGISYLTVFDKKIFNHPRYLKNQMALEIHRHRHSRDGGSHASIFHDDPRVLQALYEH